MEFMRCLFVAGTFGKACDEGRPETTKCKDCDEHTHYNPNQGYSDLQTSCMQKQLCDYDLGKCRVGSDLILITGKS